MIQEVLRAYNLDSTACQVSPFGTGLINTTWLVQNEQSYILQRVNDTVFKNPLAIAQNVALLSSYLKEHQPKYLFVTPVKTTAGANMAFVPGQGWFRLFPFVPGSHSIDVVNTPRQAFEAACQFARFTRLLAAFDITKLQPTIPQFHDLSLRYQQFAEALQNGNKDRLQNAASAIACLHQYKPILEQYEDLKKSSSFKLRVTHHDTKISNVLFDEESHGLCVIDLDTVMSGYFISDVGDMLRTYLSPVSEEEKDFSKIQLRKAYFSAIVSGYASEMQHQLSTAEKASFVYAGKFMLYMQALRFLTDYLNNDQYYGSAYEGHNLVRTNNQLTLLKLLCDAEKELQELVAKAFTT